MHEMNKVRSSRRARSARSSTSCRSARASASWPPKWVSKVFNVFFRSSLSKLQDITYITYRLYRYIDMGLGGAAPPRLGDRPSTLQASDPFPTRLQPKGLFLGFQELLCQKKHLAARKRNTSWNPAGATALAPEHNPGFQGPYQAADEALLASTRYHLLVTVLFGNQTCDSETKAEPSQRPKPQKKTNT